MRKRRERPAESQAGRLALVKVHAVKAIQARMVHLASNKSSRLAQYALQPDCWRRSQVSICNPVTIHAPVELARGYHDRVVAQSWPRQPGRTAGGIMMPFVVVCRGRRRAGAATEPWKFLSASSWMDEKSASAADRPLSKKSSADGICFPAGSALLGGACG
jgi:hypothetical protein